MAGRRAPKLYLSDRVFVSQGGMKPELQFTVEYTENEPGLIKVLRVLYPDGTPVTNRSTRKRVLDHWRGDAKPYWEYGTIERTGPRRGFGLSGTGPFGLGGFGLIGLSGTWIFDWKGGGFNSVQASSREEALQKALEMEASVNSRGPKYKKLYVKRDSIRPDRGGELQRLYRMYD